MAVGASSDKLRMRTHCTSGFHTIKTMLIWSWNLHNMDYLFNSFGSKMDSKVSTIPDWLFVIKITHEIVWLNVIFAIVCAIQTTVLNWFECGILHMRNR